MEPKTLTIQSILAFVFAFLIATDFSVMFKILPILISIFKFFTVITCLIGIGINVFLGLFSKEVEVPKDFVYRTAPIIMGVGWTVLLLVFSFQAFEVV
jgi:hypothetical protein